MCLMASRKMGAALVAASSAARLMLRIASSTCLPKPALRRVLSTLAASGGRSIFTAAYLKNPSTADNLSVLFCVPWFSASFKPATMSSELSPLPPLSELAALLALSSRLPWARTTTTENTERVTTVMKCLTMENFFLINAARPHLLPIFTPLRAAYGSRPEAVRNIQIILHESIVRIVSSRHRCRSGSRAGLASFHGSQEPREKLDSHTCRSQDPAGFA